jgi:hypothetical protein
MMLHEPERCLSKRPSLSFNLLSEDMVLFVQFKPGSVQKAVQELHSKVELG